MKTLPKQLFDKYLTDPLKYDEEVRQYAEVPDNRYFTVSVWPEERAGQVRSYVQKDKNGNTIHRVVKAKKVSKSDQPNN